MEGTPTTDQAAIAQLHERLAETLSCGSYEEAASLFAEDAVRVDEQGGAQAGTAAVRSALDRVSSGHAGKANIRLGPGQVRFLTSHFATWEGDLQVIPKYADHIIHGHVFDVLELRSGKWIIVEVHPRLFPTPGSPPLTD